MISSFSKFLLLGISTIVFSGCFFDSNMTLDQRYQTEDVRKTNSDLQVTKEYMKIAYDRSTNVMNQTTLEGTINSLATQMMRNQKMLTNKPVLITSFVRLDSFKTTSEFGRVVSESLINEMSSRGFNIIEYRGQLAVSVNGEGEYFITRKPHELKSKIPNTYIVVGTYSRQFKKIILNTRVIDNITGRIISSARSTFEHGRNDDCLMFNDCKPARTINIIKEKENYTRNSSMNDESPSKAIDLMK